jgi:PPOX class probable F420-dependent enzyme
MPPALPQALDGAGRMYVTTYGPGGRAGTVPVWLWVSGGAVYFTTARESLKARRIRRNPRVTVHVGTADGPAFEGRAEWVDDRPDLEAALLRAYRRKYWLARLFMAGHIRRRLADRRSVLVRITPAGPAPPVTS